MSVTLMSDLVKGRVMEDSQRQITAWKESTLALGTKGTFWEPFPSHTV